MGRRGPAGHHYLALARPAGSILTLHVLYFPAQVRCWGSHCKKTA
jgi:hypothetical protein